MHEYHIALEGLFSVPFLTQFHADSDQIARKVTLMLFNGLSENLMFRVTLAKREGETLVPVFTHTAPGGLAPQPSNLH